MPLHVDDDFLGHPNGLVPTSLLLHLPNLVCNHLAISLLLDDVSVALGLVLVIGLGVDEGVDAKSAPRAKHTASRTKLA
jgi:hypothetical protein